MRQTNDIQLATIFKSLSHPRRARIFRLLSTSPEVGQTFSHLQAACKINTGPLIHHLREMERCGLLTRRRKGPFVQYSLTPHGLLSGCADVQSICRNPSLLSSNAA
ncbi:MAG TPA: ArsR family transcriptional regulator [Aliiroseovarius sp.]|nr:ArsR family transcriptional regulator [Aliiroseovarius sp.]